MVEISHRAATSLDRAKPSQSVPHDGMIKSNFSPDGKLIARPGDFITCPDGHAVYRVVENVLSGGRAEARWVRKLDCDEPPSPGVVPPCPTCGCEVFPPMIDRPGRYALFVNGKLA